MFIELEPDSKESERHAADRAGDAKFHLSEKEKVKRFVALILARRQAKLLKDRQFGLQKRAPASERKPPSEEQ